jgi:L-ascorbate metabolism protein UlaG (beta-lactamase superfamily)
MRNFTIATMAGVVAAVCGLAAADRIPGNAGQIEITPIIHASVQIEYAGKVVHVDPWSEGDYSPTKPADLILVTDDNSHHLDVKAIEKLKKAGTTVVIPAIGKEKLPEAIIMANGEHRQAAGIDIDAIAMYDIKPGEPSHPKGRGNGYVIAIGGKRLYFAGVTECVPEIQSLTNIDVAFVPMNLPLQRMTEPAAADCVKTFKPKIVYPYHYDQEYVSRLSAARGRAGAPAGPITASVSLEAFKTALMGSGIEVRDGAWYPPHAPRAAAP